MKDTFYQVVSFPGPTVSESSRVREVHKPTVLVSKNLGSLYPNAKQKYRDRVTEEKERGKSRLIPLSGKGKHGLVPPELRLGLPWGLSEESAWSAN